MLPAKKWRIYDYVDHRGANLVKAELSAFPKAARAAVHALIQQIEVWDWPFEPQFSKKLKRKHGEDGTGLNEFRVRSDGVQYRPIYWFGPKQREILILSVAKELNSRFVPEGIVNSCQERLKRVRNGSAKIIDHDFS